MADWLTGIVKEKKQWNNRLVSLRIQSDFKDFVPGQFVRLALDINGERVARPYSLVNTPGGNLLEIYFNVVPEGPLSPRLASLDAGDEVFISNRASGFLVLDEVPECKHLWLLATGTGVGPFISILNSGLAWQRFEKVVLGYSVRDVSELAYQQEISVLEQQNPRQFCFVPFVTREQAPGAFSQRIPASVEDGSMEERVGIVINSSDSHVMMCGNSAMISSVMECLGKRGMKKHLRREPGHITIEKYH